MVNQGFVPDNDDGGFTLIEALVAMSVLATASVGLISAAETHIQRTSALEDRIIARWVAENVLAELRAGVFKFPYLEKMAGQTWIANVKREKISNTTLEKTTIKITTKARSQSGLTSLDTSSSLFELVSFIDVISSKQRAGQ